MKSTHCKLSNAKNIFPIRYILVELWPKWHSNRFSILATALHVHYEVKWILLACFPLHVVALILDACLCSSNHCWMLTQRSEPFVFYIMLTKEAVTMSWRSWSESWWAHSIHVTLHHFITLHHSSPQRIIQQYNAKRSCRPLNAVAQSDKFVRKQFLQCSQLRIATVLWQVAPSWKNHTPGMAPLRWSPIS